MAMPGYFFVAFAFLSFLFLIIFKLTGRRINKPFCEANPWQTGERPIQHLSQRPYLFGLDILYQDFHDLHIHNSSHRALARHDTHGNTYASTLLGHNTIHTIELANILAVTTDEFADYEKGDWVRIVAKYMGKGILVNGGEAWHASRTMLKPLFRRRRTADIAMFEPHVTSLTKYIVRHVDAGEFVDFRRTSQMIILDIATEMLTGRSTRSMESALFSAVEGDINSTEQGPALLDLIDELEPYGNMAIELGPFAIPLFTFRYYKIMSLITGIQRFFKDAVSNSHAGIQQHRQNGKNHEYPNFIEEMIAQGMLSYDVQGELQNIFFAAFDTTAALLANLFDCLAREPSVVKRLRAELSVIVGTKQVSESDLARLIYLRATIFETLRLHSPVTYHTRRAQNDTTIPRGGGIDGKSPIVVPRGTSVIWSTYALNRQMKHYGADWEVFRPERWLKHNTNSDNYQHEGFMPFGSGPRNCLGQQFAMLQTSYITARLLNEFEHLELRDQDMLFQEAAAVTYFNRRGTWIKFSR